MILKLTKSLRFVTPQQKLEKKTRWNKEIHLKTPKSTNLTKGF